MEVKKLKNTLRFISLEDYFNNSQHVFHVIARAENEALEKEKLKTTVVVEKIKVTTYLNYYMPIYTIVFLIMFCISMLSSFEKINLEFFFGLFAFLNLIGILKTVFTKNHENTMRNTLFGTLSNLLVGGLFTAISIFVFNEYWMLLIHTFIYSVFWAFGTFLGLCLLANAILYITNKMSTKKTD